MSGRTSSAGRSSVPPRLGRYEIACPLGSGGMAVVLLARAAGAEGFERLVAIKTLHDHLTRDPAFVQRFLDEARIAARLRHPNAVAVLEAGDDRGRQFIAMEYVSGETLRQLLDRLALEKRVLPIPLAVYIATAALDALDAAHELVAEDGRKLEVVHRDVTPKNLLLGYDGVPKLLDFGIAKARDQLARTFPGVRRGTISYMAPEQLEGGELDRRVDVFAVGAVLWELLAGKKLYAAKNEVLIAQKILTGEVEPLAAARPGVPPELDRIVRRALSRNAEDRSPTAAAFAAELRAVAAVVHAETQPLDLAQVLERTFPEEREQRIALERAVARATELPLDPASRSSIPPQVLKALTTVPAPPAPAHGEPRARARPEPRRMGRSPLVRSPSDTLPEIDATAQKAPAPASKAVAAWPRRIDRYDVFDAFASGGMGSIHLALLRGAMGFSRVVAIKRLHADLQRETELVAAFVDEARLMTRVRHPNIVPVLDVIEARRELLLVMEYVPGLALAELLVAPIPPPVAAALVAGVLFGLHAAHEAKSASGEALGIVHRDVSPENVLVGVDGAARLLDFGVAKAAGRLQTTRPGFLKGKLAYMPPETILCQELTRRADVYSASVVLWEALVGRPLFDAETEGALFRQILEVPVPRPSERVSGLPAALDEIVMRGMSRSAGERFATARDMAIALEHAGVSTAHQVADWLERAAPERVARVIARASEIEGTFPQQNTADLAPTLEEL